MLPPPLVDINSTIKTWNYKHGGGGGGGLSVIERGSRIRAERPNHREIPKLSWQDSDWDQRYLKRKFEKGLSNLAVAEMSPRLAVRQLLLLFENYQYHDAAHFVIRLNPITFRSILLELPVDIFLDAMPHSLPLFEALYNKVFLTDNLNLSMKLLRPEAVVMQIVKYFAQQEDIYSICNSNGNVCSEVNTSHYLYTSCKKMLRVIIMADPHVYHMVQNKRRSLEKAIEALGQHGLVGTSDECLMNLHDALKLEFEKVIQSYKIAVQKLDEMCLAPKNTITARSVYYGPAPIKASHQRQLSLKQNEIQERLIKNKTLLNVIEPTLQNHCLDVLLGILHRRIEYDKDVLFQFTQLKREAKDVNPNAIVAPILMRFSHGCDQVLRLMKEFSDDDQDSSDISGYHSDSDSAIMMSGNSPYVSKNSRYNFLYRSSKCLSLFLPMVFRSLLKLSMSFTKALQIRR